ncbi:MAG: 16S rRNA (cytosine(1402)-N(4))-methyltransferase RsmH [Spirochaetaceae bacterium]|nr:16S rRNA (cytosine(1402)-N(4))-methyltransferase RsmH [Spirochaetaceae bacterium]
MLGEVVSLFESLGNPAANVIDCTLGAGGHAEAILSQYPFVHYTGIDADPAACKRAGERLFPYSDRLKIMEGYFDECLKSLGQTKGRAKPDFVLFDLGVSMFDFFDSGRGFSFTHDEPLDMRFSPDAELTAADIVNRSDEKSLADTIYAYGGERYSRRIARAIVESRKNSPIHSSAKLADLIAGAVPPDYRRGRIHPATKTFQALRIKVNNELEREEEGLALAASLLAPSGIIAIISFHSLEDGIAKRTFREFAAQGKVELICKKPLVPSFDEIAKNPASRSAKLRALRKLPEGKSTAEAGL